MHTINTKPNANIYVGPLEDELEARDNELEKMRTDMEILGQKLIDEIEKRADLAAAQDSVQGELEELTQTLFVCCLSLSFSLLNLLRD